MKSRLLIIIGIMIAVSSLFTIAYFTNEGLDVERCINDTVYKDFTGEIVLREICIFPFTGKTITDTFIGCDEGFKQINETCVEIKQDGLHNLNSTEREDFIMNYTDTQFNGEFNDHAYIIDLQHEYAVGESITFTVVTWGYGHPCQSPSFVYYYETKDPANIVFEDKFVRLCQILEESNYASYYQELDSQQTAKASEFDIFPVFDKPGSYIVSVDDKTEYEFQIIEK